MSDTVVNMVVGDLPKTTWERHRASNLSSVVLQFSVLATSSPLIHADLQYRRTDVARNLRYILEILI